ncbi:MAG: glycoside hydrolase family 16 protein, partial [Trebonia sp.]
IKIPGGRGIWPAFWLLGTDIGHVGWPACGEIDVMENFGTAPACVYGTVHGPGYCGDSGIGGELAVGGTASVAPDRSTSFPQTMLVDYVRVHAA